MKLFWGRILEAEKLSKKMRLKLPIQAGIGNTVKRNAPTGDYHSCHFNEAKVAVTPMKDVITPICRYMEFLE